MLYVQKFNSLYVTVEGEEIVPCHPPPLSYIRHPRGRAGEKRLRHHNVSDGNLRRSKPRERYVNVPIWRVRVTALHRILFRRSFRAVIYICITACNSYIVTIRCRYLRIKITY